MSELVRSVGLLSFQQIVLMLLGATRTKFAASFLGPSGMGLLAQATSFQDLIRQVSMLGSTNGFLKLVAEALGRDDHRGLERLMTTALTLFGGIAVVLAALCIASASRISLWVFHDVAFAPLIVLGAIGLPLAVAGTLVTRVFSGALQFRAYVQLAIFDSFAGLVAMVALLPLFGLTGAVASFAIVEAAALGFGGVLLWRRVVRPLGLELRASAPDPATVKRLVRFAGALALTSLTAAGAVLLVRGEIIRQFGSEANGYYQVAWQVGQNYLGILGTSLWTYGMPKVASKVDQADVVVELQNDFLRIALAVLAPGIVLLLCARELWVPVLYTRAFLAAGGMLCWQLSGELLAMIRQSMNISLLPRERLGFLVFQALLYWGGWALLSLLLLPRLGAIAVAFGYCAANLLALVVTYAYHRAALGYRVRPDNVRLLLVTLPGFALAVLLASRPGQLWTRIGPVTLVLLWMLWNRGFYLDALRATRLARGTRAR
jgi:O-antigen/teichoic acid export membrane protein